MISPQMAIRHPQRIAVIGAGPSGLAAVDALAKEKCFETIQVFERREQVGGMWIYDDEPDVFPSNGPYVAPDRPIPAELPGSAPPAADDTSCRTATYDTLDSNVGASVMAFTHTPFPNNNSDRSIIRYGVDNPSRPYDTLHRYIKELFAKYASLVTLNTTLEKLEKVGNEWVLILRRTEQQQNGQENDFWWEEKFDAVVIASGHFSVPHVPNIPGLREYHEKYPTRLEHSKSFRRVENYIGKRVVVVGGSISAGDIVVDVHEVVDGPLYLSQRGNDPVLSSVWSLPKIEIKPEITRLLLESNGTVEFSDGTKLSNIDKIIFATGYKISYPYLRPNPVTEHNRVSGFYQHILKIGDPSLAMVGQVRATIGFRAYEYQAVAIARVLAGRGHPLPSIIEKQSWERERLEYKGHTYAFHELHPDLEEYISTLRDIAGPPASDSKGYELPPWDEKWPERAFEVLSLKERYANGLNSYIKELGNPSSPLVAAQERSGDSFSE